jgi:hypothetical protein
VHNDNNDNNDVWFERLIVPFHNSTSLSKVFNPSGRMDLSDLSGHWGVLVVDDAEKLPCQKLRVEIIQGRGNNTSSVSLPIEKAIYIIMSLNSLSGSSFAWSASNSAMMHS